MTLTTQRLLAYRVTGHDEEYTTIQFAKTNAPARREGAAEIDAEWEGVTCERAPEFDRFAALGYVPALALLEAGWWHECHGCTRRVGVDQMDSSLDDWGNTSPHAYVPEEPPMNITVLDEMVFCSPTCLGHYQAERRAWAAKESHARAEAARLYPGLTVVEYLGKSQLEDPALVILAMPALPTWQGRVGWTVGQDWVSVTPGAGEVAFRTWKRLRRQLPVPR